MRAILKLTQGVYIKKAQEVNWDQIQNKPWELIEKKTPEPLFEKTLGFFHKFIQNLPTTYPEPLIKSSFINYSEYTHSHAL